MSSTGRILPMMVLGLMIAGCTSQFNAAMTKLNTTWKEQNDQILQKEGRRRFKATRQQAFVAIETSIQRLGMVIEKQEIQTGYMLISAPAPTPLTAAEWAMVQDSDTPKMREIVSDEIGALSWLATLDPSNRDILANIFAIDKNDGVEVSISMRIRDRNPTTGRAKRMQPPPTAVRIGLRKFWSVFEEELAVAVQHRQGSDATVASRMTENRARQPTANPAVAATRGQNRDGVAVVIGNRHYGGRVPEVYYAHNDADAIKQFVVERLGFRPNNVIDLRDATQQQMLDVFGNDKTYKGQLWRWVRPQESDVIVFYSGHGVPGAKDQQGYLLPVNAVPEAPENYGYPLDLLYANLAQLDARSVTLFLDASFSGDSPVGLLVRAAIPIRVRPKLSGVSSLTVLVASQGDQTVCWDAETQHGLFTKYLLEALHGVADGALYGNGDGKVTVAEIKSYLDREMTYAARRQYGRDQTVMVAGELERVLVDLGSNTQP